MGFAYNGIHSDSMGLIMVRARRDILPPVASRMITVPGRAGAYWQGHDYEVREIEVEVFLKGASATDLRAKVRDLANWLRPEGGPRPLIFDDEPDKEYRAVLSDRTELEQIVATGRGTLTFLCPDPHAYAVAEKRRTIAAVPASFSRASVAYKSDGTQVAAGQPRFETVNGRTGILIEEGTTNLLSANQSSVETDTSGFLSATATISRDTSKSWHGMASLKVNTPGNAIYEGCSTDYINVNPSTTYTYSVYLTGSGSVRLTVYYYDSTNVYISNTSTSAITLDGTWKRYSLTFTTPSNAAKVRLLVETPGVKQAITFWVDGLQLERKPYATSWTLGGTTRAAETLTVPTAGVLSLQEGTWEQWVYIPTLIGAPDFAPVFQVPGQSGNGICLWWRTSNNWQLRTHANDNTYTDVTIPNTLSVGWHLFTVTWKQTEAKLFIDGVLKGTITNPKMPSAFAASAYIGVAISRTNQLNTAHGPVRISNIARSDAEIAAAYANGLVADEYTTVLYTFDGTLTPINNQTITNDGTAAAYPVIRAYVQRPTTFLAVATADRQILLGKPDIVESAPVEKETRILYDQLTTTTGWTTGTAVDGGVVTGTMYSDGADFRVQSYGTGSQWHGPALKKSLPELLTDFRVTAWVTLRNRGGKVGRAEVYLLDANGTVIGKMALVDRHANIDDVWAEVRAGSWPSGVYFVNTHGVRPGVWNDFYGVLQIERVGNVWRAYIGMFDSVKKQYHTRWTAQYVDVHNQFGAQLAQVQLHAATYGTSMPCDVIFHAVVVDKINNIQTTAVPYIAMPGDEIEIDCERAVVRKNGMVDLSLLDVSSRFPYLKAKTGTTFGVAPSDAAIVEITFRERWL